MNGLFNKAYQVEIDPVNGSIAVLALFVSVYIAFQIRSINRKIARNELFREFLSAFSCFNQLMLNKENHTMFWDFMSGERGFVSINERVNHILLIYINAIYIVFDAYLEGLLSKEESESLHKDLIFLYDKKSYIIDLMIAVGYEQRFIDFFIAGFKKIALERNNTKPNLARSGGT